MGSLSRSSIILAGRSGFRLKLRRQNGLQSNWRIAVFFDNPCSRQGVRNSGNMARGQVSELIVLIPAPISGSTGNRLGDRHRHRRQIHFFAEAWLH